MLIFKKRGQVAHVGGQTASQHTFNKLNKWKEGRGCLHEWKTFVFLSQRPRWTLQRLKWQHVFSPKSLLTWNIAKVKGGREGQVGRGKRQHIHLNLAPLLATLRRLHYCARHCPASSRQSLFHCANSAPWKDCKNKRWMSKAEVNRISPFFCQASEVCTNTSLRDREERRALWEKEPEKVGASSHEKANTVRSRLLDFWVYRKTPSTSIWMKDPQNTHRGQYAKDKTRPGMMTYDCKEKRFLGYEK